MSLDIGFSSQTPALPTGGGVTGLGETFTPDLSSGTGSYAVPLDIPNGPNDSAPKLTLRYSSAGANGAFGLGWTLPLPRLLRTTTRGRPAYGPGDTIVLEGSGPLVGQVDGTFRPEVDTGDWRIEPAGDGFLVTDRAGRRYRLGTDEDSRIPGLGGVVWAWLLREIEDNLGYIAQFTWRRAGAQRYLQRVVYGDYRVELVYEPRPDPLRFGRGGFLLQTDERCKAIELHLDTESLSLVRRWSLDYGQAEPAGVSVLTGITLTGFGRDGTSLEAPSLKLGYQAPAPVRLLRLGVDDEGMALPGLGDGRVELLDWQGDGLPDVLEIGRGGSARIWPNQGGRFGSPRTVGDLPQLASATSRLGLIDLNGDGIADVVRVDVPLSGYQPRTESGFDRPVRWAQAPSVSLMSPSVRLADFDGDGLVELLWSTGRSLLLARRDEQWGWEERPMVVAVAGGEGGPPVNLDDPRVFCADMSGDGTADIVRVDGGGVTYWPYLDAGGFGAPVRMDSPPRLPATVDPRRLFVVDVDGDGCADVVLVNDGCVCWWPNRAGAAFADVREVAHLPTAAMREVRVADMTGTGSPALCWSATLLSGRSAWFALDLMGGVRPCLLTSIDNSMGGRTTIHYETSATEAARDRTAGTPWTSRHPLVLPVVSEITVTDDATAREDVTRFRYHDGRFDGVLREVCGFGRVEQEDVGGDGVATLVTTRWFSTGLDHDGTEPETMELRRLRRAERGRLLRQERAGADGALLDAITYEWEVLADGRSVVPRMIRSTTWSYEGATTPVSWVVTEWRAYDADGNVTETVETAHEAGQPEPTRTLHTRTTYAHDPAGRYRQRVNRIQQDDGAGTLLADTVTEYDQLPFAEGAGEVAAEGLITARWGLALPDALVTEVYGSAPPDLAALGYHRRPWAEGWWIRIASYQRTDDEAGLRGIITGPRGESNRIAFDSTRCHPEQLVDAVGNSITAVFDPRAYQPTSITDPSGATSTVAVDPLARVVAMSMPGDAASEPAITYEYRTDVIPVEVIVRRRTSEGVEPSVERQLLDGAGRLLERRVSDESGEVCEVTTVYGPRDLAVQSFLPRRAAAWEPPSDADPHLRVEYDPLGRPIRSIRADGAVATVRYLPGVIEEADEADNDLSSPHHGTVTRRYLDATGRVFRIDQRLGDDVITTSYVHDLKGKLVQHTDAVGNVSRFTYDLFGRPLRVERPEGTYVAVLDAASNTVEARNGGHRVLRRFDAASRLIAVHHDDETTEPVAAYTYHDPDRPAPDHAGMYTLGRLVQVDHEGGSLVLDYDERGRIARKSMTLPGGGNALELRLAYRSDDRLESVTYPSTGALAPFVARYRYDRRGHLVAVDGIVERIERDLAGRVTLTRYANGVEQHDDHDPLTGWHVASRVEHAGQILRQVALTHDPVGNVTSQTSPDPMLDWTYRYDDLYRLVEAVGADSPAPRQFTYDTVGNLLSASNLGAFTYGAGGGAATCLTGVGADTFAYDARGNLVQGPWGSHTVDAQGRLRRIDHVDGAVTEFTYDHEDTLVRRRMTSATGEVRDVWSPDQLVWIEDGEVMAQVSDGERVVARVRADDNRNWLHVDHLGSLVLVTDEGGAVVRSLRYGPYGEVREIAGAEAVPQGFATGEASAAGLVLLGARWYCPRIGRFLSPDPVIADAFEPLSWNAYAYSQCNPTSYIDPTGRSAVKVFVGVVAIVAIAAVIVVVSAATFGAGGFAATAIIMGSAKLSWGAVFAATMVGIVAGGTVGALAVKTSRGGEWDDILLGALVGAAVGGWTAFGGTLLGGIAAGVGPKLVGKALSGALTGAIQNAGIGLASSFEGGMNFKGNDPFEVLGKMAAYAAGYAGVGALSGALSKLVSAGVSNVLPKLVSDTGPVTGGQVAWTFTSKLAGKALDKLHLNLDERDSKLLSGKLSGQGELSIDLGFRSLAKATMLLPE